MNIGEVARLLGRPISHVEQIARGYVKRGMPAPPPPADFAITDHYYACKVGERHLAIHRCVVLGDGREIFVVARSVGIFDHPGAAEAAVSRLNEAGASAACRANGPLPSDRSSAAVGWAAAQRSRAAGG